MKKAILVHNPSSGDGDHRKEDLKKSIEKAGFEVNYFSTNVPFWERFTKDEAEIIFVAGGDGTVQKLAKAMLEAKEEQIRSIPVQVLPYGTANNIATTLGIYDREVPIDRPFQKAGFDIGSIKGVEKQGFFIEGLGFGLFPKLVRAMEEKEEDEKQDEILQSRKELLKIVDSYEAQEAIIIADNEEITGKFLLIELMNIRYIGPNIEIAPTATTGDGNFVLVTLREDAREEFKDYVHDLLNGRSTAKGIETFADLKKVSEVRLKWKDKDMHIDDEIINGYDGRELVIKNRQGIFSFITP